MEKEKSDNSDNRRYLDGLAIVFLILSKYKYNFDNHCNNIVIGLPILAIGAIYYFEPKEYFLTFSSLLLALLGLYIL